VKWVAGAIVTILNCRVVANLVIDNPEYTSRWCNIESNEAGSERAFFPV